MPLQDFLSSCSFTISPTLLDEMVCCCEGTFSKAERFLVFIQYVLLHLSGVVDFCPSFSYNSIYWARFASLRCGLCPSVQVLSLLHFLISLTARSSLNWCLSVYHHAHSSRNICRFSCALFFMAFSPMPPRRLAPKVTALGM